MLGNLLLFTCALRFPQSLTRCRRVQSKRSCVWSQRLSNILMLSHGQSSRRLIGIVSSKHGFRMVPVPWLYHGFFRALLSGSRTSVSWPRLNRRCRSSWSAARNVQTFGIGWQVIPKWLGSWRTWFWKRWTVGRMELWPSSCWTWSKNRKISAKLRLSGHCQNRLGLPEFVDDCISNSLPAACGWRKALLLWTSTSWERFSASWISRPSCQPWLFLVVFRRCCKVPPHGIHWWWKRPCVGSCSWPFELRICFGDLHSRGVFQRPATRCPLWTSIWWMLSGQPIIRVILKMKVIQSCSQGPFCVQCPSFCGRKISFETFRSWPFGTWIQRKCRHSGFTGRVPWRILVLWRSSTLETKDTVWKSCRVVPHSWTSLKLPH